MRGNTLVKGRKPIPNDIRQVDAETWAQMGEITQEFLKKMEKNFNVKDAEIYIGFGEKTGKNEATLSEFIITLSPRYIRTVRFKTKGQLLGTMDNERVAEKLRNPEKYLQE